MKRLTILIIILFFSVSTTVFSQEFKGGLLLGATSTQVDGDNHGGWSKSGIIGGMMVEFPLSKRIDLHTEIKYFPKGSTIRNGGYTSYRIRLRYVEMPLELKLKFKLNIVQLKKPLNFSLVGGVAIGYLIVGYEDYAQGNYLYKEETTNSFTRFDFNTIYGLNFHINEKLYIGFTEQYSIVPIRAYPKDTYKPPDVLFFFKNGQYNAAIITTLYYTF